MLTAVCGTTRAPYGSGVYESYKEDLKRNNLLFLSLTSDPMVFIHQGEGEWSICVHPPPLFAKNNRKSSKIMYSFDLFNTFSFEDMGIFSDFSLEKGEGIEFAHTR